MNDAVTTMLRNFGPLKNRHDEQNAIQEVLQQIILLGLHRAGFFDKAAFYGGTALRLLYQLDRFSEDIDFCLQEKDAFFELKPYFSTISEELTRFGFSARITEKATGPGAEIESAFVKQPTDQGLIAIGRDANNTQKGQVIKIRLEVDKQNPEGAVYCKRLLKLPVPFLVQTLTLPSLFSGKLHAVIARSYLNRVKGRDYYDLQFFLSHNTPVNLKYLEAKLRDSGHYTQAAPLRLDALQTLLRKKFQSVDFNKARADVAPFLAPQGLGAIGDWSSELFSALIEDLAAEI